MRFILVLSVIAACSSTPLDTPAPAHAKGGPAVAATDDAASPYQARTWIEKLHSPHEAERAVTMLQQLGDPSAIAALGQAWIDEGKPVRMLAVLIGLARPLTPADAKAQFLTDYETSGRPASWDMAVPFLIRAVTEIDEANPRSVDSAIKAADALAEANGEAKTGKHEPGEAAEQRRSEINALAELALKPVTKKLIGAEVAALRALGHVTTDKPKAAAALIRVIEREPPPHPRTAADQTQTRALEEQFGLALGVTGAAINASAELREPSVVPALVIAMYRMPELFMQTRRALAASGPVAGLQLRAVLRGENAEVEQLFKTKGLGRYCGDHGDAPPASCQPVSAKDFYAAVVIGDLRDPAAIPDLLAALQRPAAPQYYSDDQPSASTQYQALFDALRKLGSPTAAGPLLALWTKGKDLETRIGAIGAYPFASRDQAGTRALGVIAADNTADDGLRTEAATAFARLSTDVKDIAIVAALAQKYVDASAKKAKEAAGKQQAADAADKIFEAEKSRLEAALARLDAIVHDSTKTAAEIKAAADASKQARADFKAAKQKHKDRIGPFKNLDMAAKAYLGYARMFQTHIARIEIAVRCKSDLACYAASLVASPNSAVAVNAKYIAGVDKWTDAEQQELVAAQVDRAMVELGKQGDKASAYTDQLLDAAASNSRLIRESVLLALPKIAPLPCATCESKLDAAIRAGEGKTTLGDLNLETAIVRNYFSWAGRKP